MIISNLLIKVIGSKGYDKHGIKNANSLTKLKLKFNKSNIVVVTQLELKNNNSTLFYKIGFLNISC